MILVYKKEWTVIVRYNDFILTFQILINNPNNSTIKFSNTALLSKQVNVNK